MGFTFTITQVMVIRELLVVFAGNELSIAIILANWLLVEAAGSFFLGRRVKDWDLRQGGYAFLQLLVALFLPLTLLGIRSLRDFMGLATGEGASLLQIFSWTLPLLAPLGVLNGILFALGCSLYSDRMEKTAAAIGQVYLLEAVGAGAGGACFTFLFIPALSSFQVAFLLGTANLISGFLLVLSRLTKRMAVLVGTFLLAYGFFWGASGVATLEKSSLNHQWRGVQVLESQWSPYGNVTVGRREEQLTFFTNGIPLCNVPFPDIAFMEEMVHYPLLYAEAPRRVLLIGGGLGGAIAEALKHPVEEVHYCEIDPLMVQMIQRHPTSLTRREWEDPRVRIHPLDGRLFLRTAVHPFDAIILNLPSPSTLELNRFFTVEFFREAVGVLAKGGVLSFSIAGSEAYLSPEVRDLNVSLIRSVKEVFPTVLVIPGTTHFILASLAAAPSVSLAERLAARLKDRKMATRFLTEYHIRQKLAAGRLEWLRSSLRGGGEIPLNRDAFPSGLYYAIAYWNAQFHPFFQTVWAAVGNLHLWPIAIFFLLFSIAGGIALWKTKGKRREKWVPIYAAATTGFFGSAMVVLVIFSFQTICGYAYQWIGLLIAAFMAGLAVGSWHMTRRQEKIRQPRRALGAVEILILGGTAGAWSLLALFYSRPGGMEAVLLIQVGLLLLSGISGMLVGLEFPLCGRIFSGMGEGAGRSGGVLYGADLLGAWAGSLVVGVILVPVLGIFQTIATVLLIKITSLSFWAVSMMQKSERGR
jgi:spermidine synthase